MKTSFPIIFAVTAGLLTSCAAKVKRTFVPPPAPVLKLPESPRELDRAPDMALVAVSLDPNTLRTVQALSPSLPPYRPARPRVTRKTQPATPAPVQASVPPPSPQPIPLQLEAMLSPEEEKQLKQEIEASLSEARQNLSKTRGRGLSPDQRESSQQIEGFIKQAEATRASNLEAARSLAERAALLSRDLIKSFR